MKQTKVTKLVDRFFKDKHGHWTLIQTPNLIISVWILLLVVNLFIHNPHIKLLQSTVLFTWAYLELTQGESYFRKSLGAVVLLSTVASFFM